MKYSFKTLSVSAGAVALAFAASGAFAESVNISYTNMNPGGMSVNVNYNEGSGIKNYSGSGGQMQLHVNNKMDSRFTTGSNILAWCVELGEYATSSQTVYTVATVTGGMYDDLAKLFNKYYTSVTDAVTSAAMQLAVWELTHDTDGKLSTGTFTGTASGMGTGVYAGKTTTEIAQGWLDNLEGGNGTYSVIRLSNVGQPGAQDFVTISEVPLPGAALMFLSALGLGGLARRKQRAAAPEGALAA